MFDLKKLLENSVIKPNPVIKPTATISSPVKSVSVPASTAKPIQTVAKPVQQVQAVKPVQQTQITPQVLQPRLQANLQPQTIKPVNVQPIKPTLKQNTLDRYSGMSTDDINVAKNLEARGKNANSFIAAAKSSKALKDKSDYENSLLGKTLNTLGGVGQAIVSSPVDFGDMLGNAAASYSPEVRALEAQQKANPENPYLTAGLQDIYSGIQEKTNPTAVAMNSAGLLLDVLTGNLTGKAAKTTLGQGLNLALDPLSALNKVPTGNAIGRVLNTDIGNIVPKVTTNLVNKAKTGIDSAFNGRINTPSQAGFISFGKTPKNIHIDDQAVMSDFIDLQRGTYKPDPKTAYNLELDAARIAERYGLDMPNSATKLANVFDKRLQLESQAAKNKYLSGKKAQTGSIEAGMFDPSGKLGKEPPIVGNQLTAKEKVLSSKPVEYLFGDKKPVQKAVEKSRGFASSVKNAPNVVEPVKKGVQGVYTPKTNDTLMGEAKAMLNEGVTLDFKNIKDLDKKVAATMQEAINQQAAGNHQAAADLFNNLSEHGTELGRGVQAFSLLQNMSPESVALSVAGKIKKFNAANPGKKIPELDGAKMQVIADKMAEIDLLKPGREKNIALNELNNTISDFIPSTFVDKALATWKAGLLTSLRTQERNFVGNSIHGLAEIAKDVPGSIADIALSAKTGKRTLTANIKGVSEFGSKSTRQQMSDIFSKGYDPSEQINKFDYKQITWSKNPIEQALKKYTDIVFRSLGASDKPFYNAAMSRSLYNQAAVEAINAGKRGNSKFIEKLVKNPTEDMVKLAISDANTATFKSKNAVSGVVNSLKQGMDRNEFTKAVGGVTMPFTGVPTSILGQIVNYSPAGLLKGINTARKVLTKDVPDLQRQAAQEIGRGTIGTGVFALGAYLASQGLISGQPKDAEEAKQWDLENKPRNSILINGRWYSLNSIGPETVVMLAGAKANDTLKDEEGGAGKYAVSVGKDFLDQSFVQGIQAPVNALTDPARYGTSYAGQLLSSPIPNIVKDTAKAFDPNQREMNTALDYAQAGVPGLRNQLVQKRDVLGNVMKQEPTGVAAYVDLSNSKTPVKNDVVNELSRLNAAGQNANPSKLSKSQTIGGEKVKLTPQELDKLEETAGAETQKQFDTIMKTEEYKNASNELKKEILDDITKQVRESAKNNVKTGETSTNTSSILSKAQLKLAKDSFDKSGKNYQVVGDTVLRRSTDGTITATPKAKYDYQVRTETMTQQKNNDDLKGWLSTAEQQVKSIQEQLKDPSIDPLDKVQLENDANTLIANANKYIGYGGFTKASGGKSSGKSISRLDYASGLESNYSDIIKNSDALRNLVKGITIKRRSI